MKRTNSFSPLLRRGLSFGLASCLAACLALGSAVCALLVAAPATARAQKNLPQERIATGKVVAKDGSPIAGAIVYLKDSRTNTVRTYIADQDGGFRFGELSQDTDYVLWAESDGVRSKSRQISSFDSEREFYFLFRINSAKPVSLDGPPQPVPNL